MLGESVETSAGDPSEAGKSKRVVGTNPFIVGSEVDEGNIFLNILKEESGHPVLYPEYRPGGWKKRRQEDHRPGLGQDHGDDRPGQDRLEER